MEKPSDIERWNALLDALADELPVLASRFVNRVKIIPGYETDDLVPGRDLFDTAVTDIQLMIECMRIGEASTRLTAVADELGVRRARQQVPSESLATAVQLNFSVLWGRLLELCTPEDAITLTTRVEPTWRTIDHFTAVVMAAYNREVAHIAQQRINVRQSVIARLFTPAQPSETTVRSVAYQLGCDPTAPYRVVVADQAAAQEVLLEIVSRHRHSPLFLHRGAGLTIVFWPENLYPSALESCVSELRCAHAHRVRGLGQIPGTARSLTSLLEAIDPVVQSSIDLADGVPVLARKALLAEGVDLTGELDERLSVCSDGERERIRESVEAFLETGSAQQSAARLYCHRNTVLNRLARFTELTGIDLSVPVQAVRVALAWSGPGLGPDRH